MYNNIHNYINKSIKISKEIKYIYIYTLEYDILVI